MPRTAPLEAAHNLTSYIKGFKMAIEINAEIRNVAGKGAARPSIPMITNRQNPDLVTGNISNQAK